MNNLRKLSYYIYSILEMVFNIKNWLSLLGIFLRKEKPDAQFIKLRLPPLTLAVRGAMDTWAVKETFIDQFYSKYGEPVHNGWVVVDIGAGIGDYAIHAAYGNPDAVVYAFEPFPSSHQLLVQNLTNNAISNVVVFQQAVWSRDGWLALDLSSGEPLQISSRDNDDLLDDHDVVRVEAVSLESLFQRENLSHIDVLKLDCEGAEYEILMGAPMKVLHKIKRIIMEYHDLDSAHHHGILEDFLTTQGFSVKKYRNFVHDDIGYLYAEKGI